MDSRQIQSSRIDNGRGADSGQIKAEIDHTRERIDETLDALGDKLHPRHLLEEILDYLRSPGDLKNTAGKIGQGLWHQVQEHPMPSLLIGAGLAWMLTEQKDRREGTYTEYSTDDEMVTEGEYTEPSTSRTREMLASTGESVSQMAHSVTEKTGELAHSVKEKTGELAQTLKEKTGEFTHNIKEKSMDKAARLKEATSRFGTESRQRAGAAIHVAEEKFSTATNNYPLAMGLGFLAIGVLAGLSLPRTRIEDQTMGARADELKDKIRTQGRQVVETAQRAASAAVGAAGQAAESHGITAQNLGEKIKHVASEAAHAASETAQREGLDQESLTHQVQSVASEAKRAAQEEIERAKTGESPDWRV